MAVALPSREDPVFRGEIRNQRSPLRRLIGRLSPDGEVISFCYEAGPCGYGVYREIVTTGHHCEVVAPSLIPRRAGDRVKTDRRDAVKLAGLHRAGALTSVCPTRFLLFAKSPSPAPSQAPLRSAAGIRCRSAVALAECNVPHCPAQFR